MKKKYEKSTRLLCFCAVSILLVHHTLADGYRNPPPTAEGIGKSGVNSVWVDDASAISYNPANLAFQKEQSLVLSATFARTENTYTIPTGVSFESDGDWNVLPNIYYSIPVGEKGLVFGFGVTTPYGQGLSWNKEEFTTLTGFSNMVPYEAAVSLININPTVAFKITEDISIGVGLDVYYSKLEMSAVQGVTAFIPLPPPLLPITIQTNFNAEADSEGWGIGANAGLSWNMSERQRLAVTYRSGFEIDYSGEMELEGTSAVDFDTTIKYPNMVSVGYGIQLSEKVRLETMIEWLQWSSNDEQVLEIEGQPPATTLNNWDDTFTIGIGGSWKVLDSLVVRAGYAYLPSPIPDNTITPLLPDTDRHALSMGLGYAFGRHAFDVAYTFSIYEDRSSPAGSPYSGTYDIDSNLLGLTYSTSF